MRTYIVDSNAWISYFQEKPVLKSLIEESQLKTPTLALAEVLRVLQLKKEDPNKIRDIGSYIQRRSVLLDLDAEKAVQSATFSVQEKMHLSDAIIYSYASVGEPVLTGDSDFKGKRFVEFIE